MQRLKDKVAVITGAASGVGRASALMFSREGARVVAVDLDEAGGQQTVGAIREQGGDAVFVRADVASAAEVREMAEQCRQLTPRIDVLFNNAGALVIKGFEATSDEEWARMVGVNLSSMFYCSKYLLPLIKASGRASIIHHASIDAILGNASVVAYSAAKGGILPLTHTMADELAQFGIRVNCISSGGILTALTTHARVQSQLAAVTPLRRMGTPEEVANLALFLASDESSYVNGANIVIDGGRTGITQGTWVRRE